MKKITKGLLLASVATMAIGIQSADAKVFTAEEINNISKVELTEDVTIYETIYSFGSHVYFNKITMADIVAAANTLDGKTDAILYYKDGSNVWKNAVTDEVIDITGLTFDITKITKETTDDTITDYTKDDSFVKIETNGDTISEVYAKENIDKTLKFNGVRLVTPTDIGENSKYHKFNIESLEVITTDESITINELNPLISYANGVSYSEWFGLLVDLNKEIDLNNIKVQIYDKETGKYYTYAINEEDIKDAKRHGAEGNEFVMWLSSSDPILDGTIIITEYDEDKNIIDVERKNINYNTVIPIIPLPILEEDKVISTTEGINVSIHNIEDTYTAVFFAEDDKAIEKGIFTYTLNGQNYIAELKEGEGWYTYQPIEKFEVDKGTAVELAEVAWTEAHEWNQSAFEVTTAESSEEGIDYEVTITKNKEMISYNNGVRNSEWYSLVVDLGIHPDNISGDTYGIEEIDKTDAERHGAGKNGFVMWLEADKDMKPVTFTNTDSVDNKDKITVKFVVVDAVEELTANAVLASSTVQLYPGDATTLPSEQYSINGDYAYNMASLTMDTEYSDEADVYAYNIKANRVLRSYEGGNGNKKYYAVVMDFGINPANLKSAQYIINEEDITDAARYGASETGFVMWLEADVNPINITFTNTDNKDTVTVVFDITEVAILEDKIDGTVVIKDEYKDLVSYEVADDNKDGIANNFIISTKIDKFEFSVGDVDYTYTLNGDEWTKAQSLELANVYAALSTLPEYTAEQKYNQEAIENVTFDKTTGEINVVFNRILSKEVMVGGAKTNTYGIVVDLGLENSKVVATEKYYIEDIDRTDANRHVAVENASNNNIVIWLPAELTDAEEGYTFTLANSDNENIKYDVTVKSTYAEKEPLTLTNVRPAIISDELEQDDYYEEMLLNNEGISAVVNEEGIVEITTNKPLRAYNNGYAERSYFALLIDLGVVIDKVTAINGYAINPEDVDAVQVKRFGAVDNEFILWLDEEVFEANNGEYTITFGNATETNKYNTLDVKFTFKEDIEALELKSVRMADATDIGAYTRLHAINQEVISASLNEGKVTVVANEIPAVYNNGQYEGAWFALLVDFGIDPNNLYSEQYGINSEDITDAERHGAEGTEFVMWLTLEDLENPIDLTFVNRYNLATSKINFAIDSNEVVE